MPTVTNTSITIKEKVRELAQHGILEDTIRERKLGWA